jgi:putative methyltransferase
LLDSIDAKKGSLKGLCMAEAKRGKFGKEGEAARFLKVIVEVLKCQSSPARATGKMGS